MSAVVTARSLHTPRDRVRPRVGNPGGAVRCGGGELWGSLAPGVDPPGTDPPRATGVPAGGAGGRARAAGRAGDLRVEPPRRRRHVRHPDRRPTARVVS